MSEKSLTRSFAGGELTPELFGRLDLGKYQTGLALCRNFIVTPQGPIVNRPGTELVRATKGNGVARVIPFIYSADQTLVIEIGVGYFRFHTDGATVLSAGVPYEVAHTYTADEIFDIHYVQSADVMTLTHPNHAPAELRRLGATSWTLSTIIFVPTIAAPSAPTAQTAGPGGGNPVTLSYLTTAVAAGTLEESLPSTAVTASIDLGVEGNLVEIQPAVRPGAIRYNVFKQISGLYGYIGQTSGGAFRDNNITPDVTVTPQLVNQPFAVGAITAVPVTAGGAGYGPQTGGVITAVAVDAGGSGYTSATASVADSTGYGWGAILGVTVVAGAVTAVTVLGGGVQYANPVVTIHGDGAGATATATASAIIDHNVTLTVTDAAGTGAELEPVVVNGAITGVRVAHGGSGYVAPTVAAVDAAGGAGATFGAATLTTGTVNPGAVGYFEQRRVFAGSAYEPQTLRATRSGTESNMGYSIPTRADDSITARIAARRADRIRHLVPLNDLIALSSGGVWRIASSDSGALSPSSISAKLQNSVGASNVQPVDASSAILYVSERGSHVRELKYSWQMQAYDAQDVSILAPHLFDYHTVVDMAYSTTPRQILWAVRNDGVLLGMTYAPEHEVKAWHQHTTDGTFESVCVVAEGNEDAVYVVVNRNTGRFVERMHDRNPTSLADAFFVDCGLTYDGAAATTISGLGHLEGETVAILADGGVEPQQVVSGGAITLTAAASKVHVGLPYTSDAQGMPLAQEAIQGLGQGTPKNINKAWLNVYQSSDIQAGPSFDKLRTYPQRSTEPYGSPPSIVTATVPVTFQPQWSQNGSPWSVRQSSPLPLTLLSITLEFAAGG